jgi:thiol-disulfide isomerase/thioredoxin
MKSACLLLSFGLLVACGAAPAPAEPVATEPPAAAVAPTTAIAAATPDLPVLQVATLDHGAFDLAAQRGGWVVVNFWATWCGPCIKEMPELDAFDQARADVQVIGLAYEDIAPEALRAFLLEHPVKYPLAIVDPYAPPGDFDAPRGLPMTWLIDPEGRVARKFMGPVDGKGLAEAIGVAAD